MKRVIVAACFVVACDARPDYTPSCDPAMRDWVLQCIEKGNPHSDEEPEDATAQCERTAVRLFCGPTCFVSTGGTIVCRGHRPAVGGEP